METVVQTRVGMPLEEFIRLGNEQPFELIHGERRPKLPNIVAHSRAIRALFRRLDPHVLAQQLGEVYTKTTFILPDAYDSNWVEGSRMSDAMFYRADRVQAYIAATPDWRGRPYALVPDFVVEVVSPTDVYSEVDEKVDLYLADGVRLVWVLDPQRQKAIVYAPDLEQPIHLAGEAVLDAGDMIPGFRVGLKVLFE